MTVSQDGSFLSPETFFREFTARPDIDRIMTALAQIDQDEPTADELAEEERHGEVRPRPARAP